MVAEVLDGAAKAADAAMAGGGGGPRSARMRLSPRVAGPAPVPNSQNRKELSLLWKRLTEREAECARLGSQLSNQAHENEVERAKLKRELASLEGRLRVQVARASRAEKQVEQMRRELGAALGLSPQGSPRILATARPAPLSARSQSSPFEAENTDAKPAEVNLTQVKLSLPKEAAPEATRDASSDVGACTGAGAVEGAGEGDSDVSSSSGDEGSVDAGHAAVASAAASGRSDVLKMREWTVADGARLDQLRRCSRRHRRKARVAAARLVGGQRTTRTSWRRLREEQEDLLAWRSQLTGWWASASSTMQGAPEVSPDGRSLDEVLGLSDDDDDEDEAEAEGARGDGDEGSPQSGTAWEEACPSESPSESAASPEANLGTSFLLINCSKDSRLQATGSEKKKKKSRWLGGLKLRRGSGRASATSTGGAT